MHEPYLKRSQPAKQEVGAVLGYCQNAALATIVNKYTRTFNFREIL